jgi:hypothetical protein
LHSAINNTFEIQASINTLPRIKPEHNGREIRQVSDLSRHYEGLEAIGVNSTDGEETKGKKKRSGSKQPRQASHLSGEQNLRPPSTQANV